MKGRYALGFVVVMLCAALAIPLELAAQQQNAELRRHYKLIDLGTLSGPQSFLGGLDGVENINKRRTVVGVADTSDSCSYHPGTISLAFLWKDGLRTPLAGY